MLVYEVSVGLTCSSYIGVLTLTYMPPASVLPLKPFIVEGAIGSWGTGWEGSNGLHTFRREMPLCCDPGQKQERSQCGPDISDYAVAFEVQIASVMARVDEGMQLD
jgi:hypothetical protein